MNQGSSIGIATGWTAGVQFPVGTRDFSHLHGVQSGTGIYQPSSQWVSGFFSVGVKQPLREADHLHQMPRSRIVELYSYLHSPTSIHGAMFNLLIKRKETLLYLFIFFSSSLLPHLGACSRFGA
jgi:hypothetical protein